MMVIKIKTSMIKIEAKTLEDKIHQDIMMTITTKWVPAVKITIPARESAKIEDQMLTIALIITLNLITWVAAQVAEITYMIIWTNHKEVWLILQIPIMMSIITHPLDSNSSSNQEIVMVVMSMIIKTILITIQQVRNQEEREVAEKDPMIQARITITAAARKTTRDLPRLSSH